MFYEAEKSRFMAGSINKSDYYENMHEYHRILYEYAHLIGQTIINKIEIVDNEIFYNITTKGGIDLVLTCDATDKHALPMTLLNFNEYETNETELVLSLLSKDDVVFDIGANIGWYTINCIKKHDGIQVYSFEPIRQNFDRLVKNLGINGISDANAYNVGFADYEGVASFFHDQECSMASSLVDLRERNHAVVQECTISMIDNFVKNVQDLNRVDFIKCDVEGAELFVFKGGVGVLRQFKPVVFTEMLRKWSRKFNYHPNDIICLFKRLGYSCYVISGLTLSKIEFVTEETVETNFVFLHDDKHR